MKALLNNRFAPITFTWGFIGSRYAECSEAFTRWQTDLDVKFGTRTEYKNFRAPLSESLVALSPLTSPLNRYLLTETRSGWTAIFANGLRTNDVYSPVSYLPTVLGCHGLKIACIPDRSARRDGLQIYGAVVFALYGPDRTDWLNTLRSISLTKDVNGWEFAAHGEVQPYERIENYGKRKITDRFSPEMLESYCASIGIELFSPDFYGQQCLLSHVNRPASAQRTAMSIEEARSLVYIHET